MLCTLCGLKLVQQGTCQLKRDMLKLLLSENHFRPRQRNTREHSSANFRIGFNPKPCTQALSLGSEAIHLRGGVGQGRPLKALRDLAPQLAGIRDGLEEEGVLLYPFDAKGVVDAAHTCSQIMCY